jgi:hypothetical protein
MGTKYTGSQIVSKLKEADALLSQGKNLIEICKELEITKRSYRHWRRKYNGMSPDMIEAHRVLKKEGAWSLFKVIALSTVVLGLVILLIVFVTNYFWARIFDGRFRFRECEPAALLPEVEEQLEIKFPVEITEVTTARTAGSWDSPTTTSFFNIKFSSDPDTVDTFLTSFPTKINLRVYEHDLDRRKISGLRTPKWFTEPITKGKEWSWGGSIDVYIDTTDERSFVVYFRGYYTRDLEELRKEWEKD